VQEGTGETRRAGLRRQKGLRRDCYEKKEEEQGCKGHEAQEDGHDAVGAAWVSSQLKGHVHPGR